MACFKFLFKLGAWFDRTLLSFIGACSSRVSVKPSQNNFHAAFMFFKFVQVCMLFRSRSSINICLLKCLYDLFLKILVVGIIICNFRVVTTVAWKSPTPSNSVHVYWKYIIGRKKNDIRNKNSSPTMEFVFGQVTRFVFAKAKSVAVTAQDRVTVIRWPNSIFKRKITRTCLCEKNQVMRLYIKIGLSLRECHFSMWNRFKDQILYIHE